MSETTPVFAPVRMRRAFEAICDQIRQQLADGQLAAGDRLPSEKELSEQFRVSRSGVREALRSLEMAGMVEALTGINGGFYIKQSHPDGITQAVRDMVALNQVPVSDVTEARILLCDLAIKLACERATDAATTDGSFLRLDQAAFQACRSDSIDYAVLEKHKDIAVVKFEGLWSDVGSWNAVATLHPADETGNRLSGKASALNSRNTFIHAPHRQVVALGTDGLIIVDTPDAVLVAGAGCAEQVADVVRKLSLDGCAEATEHRRVVRPWGAYDSVDNGERFQVKRLTVKPGAKLSLQMHHHRAEHWIVVQGTAKATCDGVVTLVRENESIYLPSGAVHRLENPGKTTLEVIEVQTGGYLGEDDIVRFDDTYGRCAPVHTLADVPPQVAVVSAAGSAGSGANAVLHAPLEH